MVGHLPLATSDHDPSAFGQEVLRLGKIMSGSVLKSKLDNLT
jgi:hypothetical protein